MPSGVPARRRVLITGAVRLRSRRAADPRAVAHVVFQRVVTGLEIAPLSGQRGACSEEEGTGDHAALLEQRPDLADPRGLRDRDRHAPVAVAMERLKE